MPEPVKIAVLDDDHVIRIARYRAWQSDDTA